MRARQLRRGYTLVELMAVVAMIGIMAVLAVASYRYVFSRTKNHEIRSLLGLVHAGQAGYRDRTRGYLNCSTGWDSLYPQKPTGKKMLWNNPGHADYDCWRLLDVESTAPTYIGVAVRSGYPGETPPQPPVGTVTYPEPTTDLWYVVLGAADEDGDGKLSYFVTTSFAPNEVITLEDTE